MATPILIPDADMRASLAAFQPGRVVPFTDLYAQYERVMRGVGQAPASRQALGRALTRVGCERKKVRKSRGGRGNQRVHDTYCWIIPGAPTIPEEDVRMTTALRFLLDGREQADIHDNLILEGYRTMGRRHGWRWLMGPAQVTEWLNLKGFAKVTEGGQRGPNGWRGTPSRYVHVSMLDWIYPEPKS